MTIRNTVAVSAVALSLGLLSAPMASAQTPVKLGVLADMSGIFSDIGGMGSFDATKMAVEDFNKLPGADKFKVEVIQGDPQNKPDIARNIARKWYETEGVDVLVDIPTSATSLAVAPLTAELNKVALFTASGTSDLTGKACTPNSVHWTYDTWALAHGTADAMTKAGGKSWFFLTVDFALGASLERDATAVINANGGKVLGSIKHPTDLERFRVLSAAGAGLQGRGHRTGECRRRYHQGDQAGV